MRGEGLGSLQIKGSAVDGGTFTLQELEHKKSSHHWGYTGWRKISQSSLFKEICLPPKPGVNHSSVLEFRGEGREARKRSSALHSPSLHSGGCQNYGPFLGTLNMRCRLIIGIQKGIIILTTTQTLLQQRCQPVREGAFKTTACSYSLYGAS